ncbi:hypothetical protein IGI04_036623, partial [Brassica rapa subsp. trilocularis]
MKKVKVSYVRLTFVTIIMVSLNLLTSNDHYESSGVKTQNMLNTMSQICSGTNSNMAVPTVYTDTNNYLSQLEGTTESLQYLKSLKLEHGSKSKRRHVDEAFKRFTSDMWMKLSNVRHVDEALKRFTSIWIQLLRKRLYQRNHGGQGLTTTQLKQYDLFHVDHT